MVTRSLLATALAVLFSACGTQVDLPEILNLSSKDKDKGASAQVEGGNATFDLVYEFEGWEESGFGFRALPGDFRGTGVKDVVIQGTNPGWEGPQGTGRRVWFFSSESLASLGVHQGETYESLATVMVISDINGDGRDDLLGRETSNTLATRTSDQHFRGEYFDTNVPEPTSSLESPHGIIVAVPDMTGDGKDEILSANPAYLRTPPTGGKGRVDLLNGATGQIMQTWIGEGDHDRFGSRVIVGDFTGSNALEMAVMIGGIDSTQFDIPHKIEVYSLTTGSELLQENYVPGENRGAVGFFNAGDQNGDGKDDIAIGGGQNGAPLFGLYRVAGNSVNLIRSYNNGHTSLYSVSVVDDFDGDGRKDFLYSGRQDSNPFDHLLLSYNGSSIVQEASVPAGNVSRATGIRVTSDVYRLFLVSFSWAPCCNNENYGKMWVYEHNTSSDSTDPSVSLGNLNVSVSGTQTVTATANDAGSIRRVEFFYDNFLIGTDATAPYSVSWDTRKFANGAGTVRAVAIDNALNTSESLDSVTINNSDSVLPTISFISPSQGGSVEGAEWIVAQANDNHGIKEIRFTVEGEEFEVDNNSLSIWNLRALWYDLGPITVVGTVTDFQGNQRSATLTVNNVDTHDPTAQAPQNEDGYFGLEYINTGCWDGHQIQTAILTINGQQASVLTRDANGNMQPHSGHIIQTNQFGTGSKTFAVQCSDAAGNTATDSNVVSINPYSPEGVAPTLQVTRPAESGGTYSSSFYMEANASDVQHPEGVSFVEFRIDGQVVGIDPQPAYNSDRFNYAVNTRSFANGPHSVDIIAIDRSGNSTTESRDVFFFNTDDDGSDTQSPTTQITQPSDGETVSGDVEVRVTATDDDSVAGVQFYVNNSLKHTDSSAPFTWNWATTSESNGAKLLKAVALDPSGNEGEHEITVTVSNAVDDESPVVTIISPMGGSVNGDPFVIEVGATDNVAVDRVSASVNGLSVGTDFEPPYTFVYDPSNNPAGHETVLTISAIGYDPAGNFDSDVTNVTVDLFGPNIEWQTPPPGTISGTVNLSAMVSDVPAGVAEVRVYFGQDFLGTLPPDPSDIYSWTLDTTVYPDESIQVARFAATDRVGNVHSEERQFFVNQPDGGGDSTPPEGSIDSPVEGSVLQGTIPVIVTAFDVHGQVASVEVTVRGASNQVLLVQPLIPPSLFFAFDTTQVPDQAVSFHLRVEDDSQNVFNAIPVNATISNNSGTDTEPPVASTLFPTPGSHVQGVISLQASATDNVAVERVEFYVDDVLRHTDFTAPYVRQVDMDLIGEGGHTYKVIAFDTSGNSDETDEVNFTSTFGGPDDEEDPVIAISSPQNQSTIMGTVELVAAATDNIAVTAVRFEIDGVQFGPTLTQPPYVLSVDTTQLLDGSSVWRATAEDAAGNTASDLIGVIIANNGGGTVVNITSPQDGSTVSGMVNIAADASDDAQGITEVEFRVDGAFLSRDTTPPYTAVWDATSASAGSHSIRAIATNGGGATNSDLVTVTVQPTQDTEPPVVNLTAPDDGAVVAGTVVVSAAATDNVGVQDVKFYIGDIDGSPDFTDTTAPYEYSWDTTSVADGTQVVIHAVASDGQNEAQDSRTVNVNNSGDINPPTISMLSPAPNTTYSDTTFFWSNQSDTEGPIDRVEFWVGNTLVRTIEDPADGSPAFAFWNPPDENFPDGTYTVEARAYDMAGNVGSAFAENVTYDYTNDPPTVNFVNPQAGETVGGIVNVVIDAVDDGAVAGVVLRVNGSLVGDEDTEAPYEFSWDTTSLQDGPIMLEAYATDDTNLTGLATLNVTVDNSASQITFLTPAEGDVLTNTGISVIASVTDVDGLASVSCRVVGFPQSLPMSVNGSLYTCSLPVTLPEGYHSVEFVATDVTSEETRKFLHIGYDDPATSSTNLGIPVVRTYETPGRLRADWENTPGATYNVFVTPQEPLWEEACTTTAPGVRFRLGFGLSIVDVIQAVGIQYFFCVQRVNAQGTSIKTLGDTPAVSTP